MSGYEELEGVPAGTVSDVRLFPLPNLVLFPHVLQPLHVYERRYCELVEDALADDSLIAMALLQPGWESDYEGRPPVASTVCVGRVASCSRDANGHFNLLLMGVSRARIRHELPVERPFRCAEVRYLGDDAADADSAQRQNLSRTLIDLFRRCLPKTSVGQEPFQQLLASQIPLGVLTDIVAFTLQFDLRLKQQLLEQLNVDHRAMDLIRILREWRPVDWATGNDFPPSFSSN